MRRNIFLTVFICAMVGIGIMVIMLGRSQSDRFLERDVIRNGEQLQHLLERFHETLGQGTYPDSIYQLFHSGSVWDRDRMRNPYTNDSIRISDDRSVSFEQRNFLYVVTKRNNKQRPVAYKIYMLGRHTDPFYDFEKAMQWHEEYRKFSSSLKSPDNIVMVFTSNETELPDE